MYTRDAVAFFKNKRVLTQAAGVKPQSFYSWGEVVPQSRAARLSAASGGVLVYDPEFYDNYKKKVEA